MTNRPDQCKGHNCTATTVELTGLCRHHLAVYHGLVAFYFNLGFAKYATLALADIKDGSRPTGTSWQQ